MARIKPAYKPQPAPTVVAQGTVSKPRPLPKVKVRTSVADARPRVVNPWRGVGTPDS